MIQFNTYTNIRFSAKKIRKLTKEEYQRELHFTGLNVYQQLNRID